MLLISFRVVVLYCSRPPFSYRLTAKARVMKAQSSTEVERD